MKYVKEFGVFVDNNCNIYSVNRKGEIYAVPWQQGGRKGSYDKVSYYPCDENWIRLPHNGKQTKAFVHRIISTAFVPNPENKPTVDHINRNSHDNRPENLRWCTYKEQQRNRAVCDISYSKYGIHWYEDKEKYNCIRKRFKRMEAKSK